MGETSVREGEEIQFGDLITLFVHDGDGNGGFLSAEGMLDEDCKIAPGTFDTPPTDLHSCVFRVMPMYQYYAQTEYRDHVEKIVSINSEATEPDKNSPKKSPEKKSDNSEQRKKTENDILRTTEILHEALEKEIQLNVTTAQRRFGQSLCYGQSAMLLHYKSQKILTMFPQQVASHETSCLKVQLNDTGRLTSALVFNPRFRIHTNGDNIESMHQMLIEFPKQDGQMLHANLQFKEVSASTTPSTWKICRYSPFNRREAEYVNISQMIRLYEPNAQSYAASNGTEVYLEKMNDDSTKPQNSNSIWILESKDNLGGFATWKHSFRLQHLNSNKYMQCLTAGDNLTGKLGMSSKRTDDGTMYFSMYALSKKLSKVQSYIKIGQGVQITRDIRNDKGLELRDMEFGWFHQGPPRDDHGYELWMVKDYSQENTFQIQAVPDDELTNACFALQVGRECCHVLKLLQDEGVTILTLDEAVDSTKLLVEFCTDTRLKGLNFDQKVRNILKSSTRFPIRDRQNLIREQNVFEVLLEILNLMARFIGFENGENEAAKHNGFTTDVAVSGGDIQKRARLTCKAIYFLIEVSFANNHENSMYVARWMDVMIKHVDLDIGSDRCLTQMLDNNEELLNQKVDKSHVELFLQLIVRHGMKPMFLRFLCNLCIVDGKAMGTMQDLVCSLLKKYKDDLFIKCFVGSSDENVDMEQSFTTEIQVFKQGRAKSIPGESLLHQDGVKPLRLRWNKKWAKGGVSTMLLHELVMMSGAKRRMTDSGNPYNELYNYFLEQLRLFNALCLNRNYLGILYIEEHLEFSYEILMQGIMDKSLPWGIREHFCRLMTSLHIDREPYVLVTYPNLTRLADEKIDQAAHNRNGNNQFVLLQCYLLQHLREFSKMRDDEANQHHVYQAGLMRFMTALVDALLRLVQLDFFSRPSMVRAFLAPLIKCLDGTGDSEEAEFVGARNKFPLSRSPSLRIVSRNPVLGTARGKKSKVFPERALPIQRIPSETIPNGMDEAEDVGLTCWQQLRQKKLGFVERLDIFINATEYMIVLTSFVFISTIVGFISYGLDLTPERTDFQNGLMLFSEVVDFVFVCIFGLDVGLRMYVMGTRNYIYDTLCFLDLLVSSIDLMMIGMQLSGAQKDSDGGSLSGSVGSASQILRLFRVVRIVRITKAIRAAKHLLERKKDFIHGLPTPTTTARYDVSEFSNTVTDFKLGITRVLQAFILQTMDYQLSNIVLGKDWENLEKKMRHKDIDIMTIAKETNKPHDMNALLVDLIMYKRSAISEAALSLLFSLHFEQCTLFRLFHRTQLVEGADAISKVKKVRADLAALQNSIETYEVWIRDSNKCEDEAESLCSLFQELAEICKGSTSMQNVMRDSGAMRAIEQCLQDIILPEEDDVDFLSDVPSSRKPASSPENYVHTIYGALNAFVVSFIRDNPTNQQLISEHVNFFIESIGSIKDSAAVVGATLLNNIVLCAPISGESISKIVLRIDDQNMFSVQCLNALVNIVHVSEAYLRSNQKKVINSLCHPKFSGRLRRYLVNSPKGFSMVENRCLYLLQQKHSSGQSSNSRSSIRSSVRSSARSSTRPSTRPISAVESKDEDFDEVDWEVENNKMCFHVRLLQLLAHCCNGQVATIEAQSQSLYDYKDLLTLLMSPPVKQVWPLRVALCGLFKNMYLVTETKKNGLATCPVMLKMVRNLCKTLNLVTSDHFQNEAAFSFQTQTFGQKLDLLHGFQRPKKGLFDKPRMTDMWWSPNGFLLSHVYSNLLPILFHYIEKYRMEFLTSFREDARQLTTVLENLRQKSLRSTFAQTRLFQKYIEQCLSALDTLPFNKVTSSLEKAGERRNNIRRVIPSIRKNNGGGSAKHAYHLLENKKEVEMGPSSKQKKKRQLIFSRTLKMNLNSGISLEWYTFLSQLDKDKLLDTLKQADHTRLTEVFRNLPPKGERSLANILQRIVKLVRNKIRTIRDHTSFSRKIDDKKMIKLATDSVNFLNYLIETKDDELEKTFWRNQISDVGAMPLVLDLVAIDIPKDLTRAALNFGITLLDVSGGNKAVQMEAFKYLASGESEPFFFAVDNMLLRSVEDTRSLSTGVNALPTSNRASRKSQDSVYHIKRSDSKMEKEANTLDRVNENSISLRVIELLQLLCEGNFKQNQLMLLSQPENQVSKNIMATITLYLTSVIKHLIVFQSENSDTGYEIAKQIYELLVDGVQGPCLENQVFLACETELLEATNTLLRNFGVRSSGQQALHLEEQVYVLLLSLIEGRDDVMVHDKITSMVKFKEVFRRLSELTSPKEEHKKSKRDDGEQSLLYSIITLLYHLRDHKESWFQRNIKAHKKGTDQRKRLLRNEERMCCVEVFWMGKLHRVHFAVPNLCDHVSSKRQNDMEQKFDRSNIDKKLASFMKACTSLYAEMKGQRKLVDCGVAALFKAHTLEQFSSAGYGLSIFLTLLLTVTYRAYEGDDRAKYVTLTWIPVLQPRGDDVPELEYWSKVVDTSLLVLLLVLGIILTLLNLYSLIARVLMHTTLVIAQEKGFMHVFWNTATWFRVAFLICSICGLVYGSYPDMAWYTEENPKVSFLTPQVPWAGMEDRTVPSLLDPKTWRPETCTRPMHNTPLGYLVYAFQMLDIFNHNEKAQYVLMAIRLPLAQIIATLLLMMIFMFIFSAVAFSFFRNVLVSNNQCETLQGCFLTVLNYGPRLSGGIGDFLSPDLNMGHTMWPTTLLWSLLAFLIVNVIMLNVLFGIIVDTFGTLRATELESTKDISNICYICGLDRQTLDRKGNGFAKHIKTDHQKWNYMKYIVHLREKDPNDYNGLEHHVVRCIDDGDNGWFPVNRAMCLTEHTNNLPKDDIETQERRAILQKLSELQEDFLEMRSNLSTLTATVNTTLSGDSSSTKFANVVDSVMQKGRVSKMLRSYVVSR